MEWIIGIIGVSFIAFILLLLSDGGSPIQPGEWGGPSETPMPIEENGLLPIYYDKQGNDYKTELEKADSASSLEESITKYHNLRKHHSAIVELNLAKLSLDKLARDGSLLSPSEYQKSRAYILKAISDAEGHIKSDKEKKVYRYPRNIGEYVKYVRDRLG